MVAENQEPDGTSCVSTADFPRAVCANEEAYAMWIQLFTVVLTIALGFGLGALALESYEEAKPVRNLRQLM